MIQQNQRTQEHCDDEVLRTVLNCNTFYILPNLYNENWESIPVDSGELNERMNLLKKAQNVKQRDMEREPHHFLSMLLSSQVYEGTLPHYADIHNEDIQRLCKGGLTTETTIKLAEIKIALICKYLRFIQSALDAFSVIIHDYSKLHKKNHITQKVVNDELNIKLALNHMLHNLSGSPTEAPLVPDSKTELYSTFKSAKKLGISFKELKKTFPLYRSTSSDIKQFTYCIWTYAYNFFANNFTYTNKKDATIFAYGSMEYIRHSVCHTIYNPPIDSTHRSILDGISEQKSKPSYVCRDTIHCDIKDSINLDSVSIGIYFPHNNTNFTEPIK